MRFLVQNSDGTKHYQSLARQLGGNVIWESQSLPQGGQNGAVHPIESQIVRVATVNRATIPALSFEQGLAVHEPDLSVPTRNRVRVCPLHDLTTFTVHEIVLMPTEIGLRHENHGQLWMLVSDV